jgi:hypothetical protein
VQPVATVVPADPPDAAGDHRTPDAIDRVASSSTTSTVPVPADALAVHAANEAALVMMCQDGLHNAGAASEYRMIAAAQPTLARSVGADCLLVATSP